MDPVNDHNSRLLGEIEQDGAYAAPLLRVRAARETAALLRGLRKRAGLTQQAIAAKLGVSQARISQVESGVLDFLPPLDFIYLFTDACSARLTLSAIQAFEIEIGEGESGEKVTREVPNISEESLKELDERGIITVGAKIQPGDILVGKVSPQTSTYTPEEKLLRAIYGENVADVRDTSLRVPPGTFGSIVKVQDDIRSGRRSIKIDIALDQYVPASARSGEFAAHDNVFEQGIPESFNTLAEEMQSVGYAVEMPAAPAEATKSERPSRSKGK